jgi:hypothetical protein
MKKKNQEEKKKKKKKKKNTKHEEEERRTKSMKKKKEKKKPNKKNVRSLSPFLRTYMRISILDNQFGSRSYWMPLVVTTVLCFCGI